MSELAIYLKELQNMQKLRDENLQQAEYLLFKQTIPAEYLHLLPELGIISSDIGSIENIIAKAVEAIRLEIKQEELQRDTEHSQVQQAEIQQKELLKNQEQEASEEQHRQEQLELTWEEPTTADNEQIPDTQAAATEEQSGETTNTDTSSNEDIAAKLREQNQSSDAAEETTKDEEQLTDDDKPDTLETPNKSAPAA